MSNSASNAAPVPLVNPSYYDEGVRWEQSVYQRTVNSLRVWRGVALILGVALLVALGALVLLAFVQAATVSIQAVASL